MLKKVKLSAIIPFDKKFQKKEVEEMLPLQIDTEATNEIVQTIEENLSDLTNIPTSISETDEYLKNLIHLLEEFAVTYGGKLILAIIILIAGFKLSKFLTKKLFNAKSMNKLDTSTKGFAQSIVGVVLKLIVGITALSVIGVPMSSMIAVIGSCGLAIGLALQGSLANIAGGFILLFFKPFTVGDMITTAEISGVVEDIGIFHTRITTVDNRRIIVPNANISNATLTNVTALKNRRVDLTFNASYHEDINKVERVLLGVCDSHPLVLKDPTPFARLSAHKDSALEYTLRVWCKTEDYWTVYFDLIRDVKLAFDKEGIEIPFPQLDVHADK